MYKIIISVLFVVMWSIANLTWADNLSGIGSVATNVTHNISSLAKLITAGAYIAGMFGAVVGIYRFKAHKDNPTQVPLSTAFAYLLVSSALLFLPTIFKISGSTLFGSEGKVAGVSGITSFGAGKG